MSEIKNCPVCSLPLGEMEISLNRVYHYACIKCIYCNEDITHERRDACVKKEIPLSHITCYDKEMEREYKQRPVSITQEMLDWHNERRLIFDINEEMTVASNQLIAASNFRTARFVHEMNPTQLYIFVKRLEAIAAEGHIIINESNRKDALKSEIAARDKNLVKQAESQRKEIEEKREEKRNRYTPLEKSIKALMAIGLSREDAVQSVKEQDVKKLMRSKNIGENEARLEIFGSADSNGQAVN